LARRAALLPVCLSDKLAPEESQLHDTRVSSGAQFAMAYELPILLSHRVSAPRRQLRQVADINV